MRSLSERMNSATTCETCLSNNSEMGTSELELSDSGAGAARAKAAKERERNAAKPFITEKSRN